MSINLFCLTFWTNVLDVKEFYKSLHEILRSLYQSTLNQLVSKSVSATKLVILLDESEMMAVM